MLSSVSQRWAWVRAVVLSCKLPFLSCTALSGPCLCSRPTQVLQPCSSNRDSSWVVALLFLLHQPDILDHQLLADML
jgi:hypothetical protein